MTQNYIKLYNTSSEPDSAFLLEDGQIFLYPNSVDKYAIHGKNLIIGATEIIMNNFLNLSTGRIETAISSPDSRIKRMPVEKFLSGMKSYSFILNVSMVLAKQVLLTNKIIQKNIELLEGDEKKVRELSIKYYTTITRIRDEFEKRKLPWLKDIIKEFEINLTYKKGEAYYKSSEPTKITAKIDMDDKLVEYSRDTIICEENTKGEELFILQSGVIDVIINGNSVATIEEPGTVSGEMALLLGETRTATLKAKNNVVLTKITKKDLKEVAEKQNEVLIGIASSLAKRHYYNIIKIENLNEKAMEQALDREESGKNKIPQSQQAQKELNSLKNCINDIYSKKDADFLEDLIETL